MDSDDEHEPNFTSINPTDSVGLISRVRVKRRDNKVCCYCIQMWIRIFVGLVLFTLIGGIVYGFNGLKEVMIDLKMYSSACAPNATLPCADQLYWLNSIFQTTAAGINIFSFVIGILTDFMDQTLLFYIAATCVCASMAVQGFLIRYRWFDHYFWWGSHLMFFLMGNGGGLMMFAFFKWMFTIPRGHKYLALFGDVISSLFTAAWDLSAVMFYLYAKLYFNTNVGIVIPFEVTAGVVFIGCFIFGFFLKIPKKWVPAPNVPDISPEEVDSGPPPSKVAILRKSLFGIFKYACSWRMWFLYIWMSCGALQFYFLLSTIYDQALWLTGDKVLAKQYNDVFSILLPFVGFIFSGILGFFINRLNLAIIGLVLLNLTYTVLSCIPIASPYLQFPFYCLLVIGRIYTFVILTKTIRHYFCSENPVYFGRLLSLVLTVGGLVALLSTPMNILTSAFHGSFFQVNIIVGAIAMIGNMFLLALPVVEFVNCIKKKAKQIGNKDNRKEIYIEDDERSEDSSYDELLKHELPKKEEENE